MVSASSRHYRFEKIQALGSGKQHSEAQALLERLAKQVQPVMIKHQWAVGLLLEGNPRDTHVLGYNYNKGQKIVVRLRRSPRSDAFMEYHCLLGTLLHELTHNEIGPHNAAFYKLLDELKRECEEYMARGISGAVDAYTLGKSERLGGASGLDAHTQDPHVLRQRAAKAAEERERRGRLMWAGPRTLGSGVGGLEKPPQNPREAAAQAAIRRAEDNKWCPAENEGALEAENSTANAQARQQHQEEKPRCEAPLFDGRPGADDGGDLRDGSKAVRRQDGGQGLGGGGATEAPGGGSSDSRVREAGGRAKQARHEPPPQQLLPDAPRKSKQRGAAAVIDLTGDSDDAEEGGAVGGPVASPTARGGPSLQTAGASWTCSRCTLVNRGPALQCTACLTQREP